jgi:hypothetical protein
MLDPYILSPVLNSLSFGISEFHLRMRQICRPKLYRDREQTQVAPSAEPMGNFHIQILTGL